MHSTSILRSVLISLFLLGTSSFAQALTWDFTGFHDGEGTIGNSRTFIAEGITVTATAWSYTSNGFEQARLGQWGIGLGVCSVEEACGDPLHQVDNAGQNEYVLFQFSEAVIPVTVEIAPYGTYDRDVSYWTGTGVLPANLLDGETYGSLSSLGFFPRIDSDGTVASYLSRDVSISSPAATALLFGPKYLGGEDDYFKIRSISAVPEPTSLFLLTLGLFGLIGIHTRRPLIG